MFINILKDQLKLWVRIRDGDVGLEPLPYSGRVDVHISCKSLQTTAHWLRVITREIDKVRPLS